MSGRVISIANQKGGVGKTTTTMNLGVGLAREGRRVLLVDNDPQSNLTSYLGVDQPAHTLDEIYLAKKPLSLDQMTGFALQTASGVDLIAADPNLSGVEFFLFSKNEKEKILHKALDQFKDIYDFILVDTPPSLNLLTLNALYASNHVLIPVQPEFFSLEGIVKIRSTIDSIRESWNPSLSIIGVLANQVSSRRKLTGEVLDALKSELGTTVFSSMIHDAAAITESSGHGKSVMEYDRSSRGAAEYLDVTRELLGRMQ